VYNVEIATDLSELNAPTARRRSVRDALEKAIAAYEATNMCLHPVFWPMTVFDNLT
jgi:hypothetical protein